MRRSKKNQNKKIIGLIAAGAALYFLMKDEKASNQNDNLTTTPTPQSQATGNNTPAPQQQSQATGNNRAYIVKVQQFLNSKGYKIAITGVWNKATNDSQVLFMQRNKIKTSATFRKLVESWKAPRATKR